MNMACVILAGGEGRRMGGSKPLRALGKTTLIGNALELARRYGAPMAVAARAPGQVGVLQVPLVIDDASIPGPLAGVAAALGFAIEIGAERVLTIPCDMPRLPTDLGARLAAALEASPHLLVAVAARGGRMHPVCALWKVEALGRLRSYAGSGQSSIKGFASACGSTVVQWDAEGPDPFVNANTPDDLAALQAEFGV